MAQVPTISITNPDLESEDLNMNSPVTSNAPDSPTVFDVVKDMEDLENEIPPVVICDEPSTYSDGDEERKANSHSVEPDIDGITGEDEKRSMEDAQPCPLQLQDFYQNKSVLITGATGSIGKAVLWKLMASLHHEIHKIYLLIRPGSVHRKTATSVVRFQEEILSNKAFVNLRRSMGVSRFDNFVNEKVHVLNGDLTHSRLALSANDYEALTEHVNIIFNCSGTVDGHERLDFAVKTNVSGTMNLVHLANDCESMAAFVQLSPLQVHHTGASTFLEDRLYPMPTEGPVAIYQRILDSDHEEIPIIAEQLRTHYPNTYLFSKSLAEHLLVKEVEKKRASASPQYPIAIMRVGPVGPSVSEPLIGWADGVNGVNGLILLTGRGTRAIQPAHGETMADVVPVDFVVRMILGCVTTISTPATQDFMLPYADDTFDTVPNTETPTADHSSAVRDSGASSTDTFTYRSSGASRTSSKTSAQLDPVSTFPYIYHVSMSKTGSVPWKVAYNAIRLYWTRATGVNLPTAQTYFATSSSNATQGLSRARTVMNTLRSAASSYMGSNQTSAPAENTARMSGKRNSHRLSRCMDKAIKLAPTVKGSMASGALLVMDNNTDGLKEFLQSDQDFGPHYLVPEETPVEFWINYFINASYGMHYFVGMESDLRLPTPVSGWSCALQLYGQDVALVIDRQVNSIAFSADQISKRTTRMVRQIKDILMNTSATAARQSSKMDEEWLTDLDDSLDDWCQDEGIANADKEKRIILGKWRRKVGSNDEAVKVVVLNDKRVNQAIHQITQNAGVSKQTAVNEAIKILMRMSERTQLAFVWFSGSFLKSLFDDMFENVRIREETLRYIRDSTAGKRVVYVPVSRSILDPLLIWYIAIRYQLPVPALACDEAFAQLGPISDIYRLTGAYYVKRDKSKRSPLNSAVMAAYTQVLLREHGALCMSLEKFRSRTGKYEEIYDDGLIDMVIEATLQSNQARSYSVSKIISSESSPPTSPSSPISPSSVTSPTNSIDSKHSFPNKAHKDVVIVPINITYENVPELPYLIDEVLDQQPNQRYQQTLQTPIEGVVRPSEAMDKRNRLLEGADGLRKCGRALFGVGRLISVQDTATDYYKTNSNATEAGLVQKITKQIHESQSKAFIVSPISLVSAIVLYGRGTGGVCLGKIKDLMEWLRQESIIRGYQVDWQDGEDLDAIIFYAFKLLDESKNLIIEGKEVNDDTNIRVNDHADNVMTLSYYANQIIDLFLLDAFFAVVYLSFTEEIISEDEFTDRFHFLVQMLEREFVLSWDINEKLNTVITAYENRKVISKKKGNGSTSQLALTANMESNPLRYEQLVFLASLVYPTIDSYWITSCSLSALEVVPMLPRRIVPLLAQWIATHLITGRRTIYREVLSTESSRTAVEVFMMLGFLTEIQAKEKLSPDAQILLHELDIPTTETLIELSGQNSDGGKTPVSPIDPEGMMKALMAQIQMNRANSNMADLCQQIDSYRLGAASQRESFQNAQVFQKCLKQIRGIFQTSTSLAKKRRIQLSDEEDGLVQLVYALRTNSAYGNDRTAQGRALRRISEAYNLK
ncbi:cyclin-dependent kinase inhibitor far1 [Apophysomyces ossiformis]|uniref:Cyclin-dependent kinase inhibitor far1 n=1 Tax=Apophysomyces ossiformis TaxID=679940 RepID=A0A8H7EQI8_9FUNG|nr:cyclin-dependent kinase inhibitor far1 [Apophysomyces ossiformis]